MSKTQPLPPETASSAPLSQDCGKGIAVRPKFVLSRIHITAAQDEITDSCAENSLSSSAASPPSAPWDPKEPSVIARLRGGASTAQDPEGPSVTTTQHNGATKRLHAALSPVDEDDADADLRAKRGKLIRTLQDAEEDGMTNWFSHLILYNEKIEHPETLRTILNQAFERGISHLSLAEIESITAVQDDERAPQPVVASQASLRDNSTSSLVPSSQSDISDITADKTHLSPPVPSKPGHILAPVSNSPAPVSNTLAPVPNTPSAADYDVSAPPTLRHRSGWTPLNGGDSEDGGGNFYVASLHQDATALADEDDDDDDEDGACPEVGGCFRSLTYRGAHPGTTWAAFVEPLVVEDMVSNMQAGKKAKALRRATAATKRKKTPQTPSPQTKKHKR